MESPFDLVEMDRRIREMRELAEELSQMGDAFPALARNTARILASIKMLEINICDVVGLQAPEAE
jgi:hypothetical protein